MLGLTAPCRHFFSCRAARASASRAPTDTACAGASGPSRRRSSSVPPAGARMQREGRGGERSLVGVMTSAAFVALTLLPGSGHIAAHGGLLGLCTSGGESEHSDQEHDARQHVNAA